MMVNLLDDSNFHRQTAVMTRLIEMIIQNPVFGIFCIISMLAHPTTLQDTFNDLLSNIQKPLGIHHIRTILFSLPVNYLKDLRDFGLDKGGVDAFSPKYRLKRLGLGIGLYSLFQPFLIISRLSYLKGEEQTRF
jgi:hypothetical protein